MAEYAYKGIPIIENGYAVAVKRVRTIQAADKQHYRGTVDIDSRGNKFVYRKYPGFKMSIDILPWTAGESVYIGDMRLYENIVYKCIQSHITQSDWPPPLTPALWKIA